MTNLFYPPTTWGEAKPNSANSWGTIAMTWGGFFLPASSYKYLGVILFDATPSMNVPFVENPHTDVLFAQNPSADVKEI